MHALLQTTVTWRHGGTCHDFSDLRILLSPESVDSRSSNPQHAVRILSIKIGMVGKIWNHAFPIFLKDPINLQPEHNDHVLLVNNHHDA